jgi:hypothetical protein
MLNLQVELVVQDNAHHKLGLQSVAMMVEIDQEVNKNEIAEIVYYTLNNEQVLVLIKLMHNKSLLCKIFLIHVSIFIPIFIIYTIITTKILLIII